MISKIIKFIKNNYQILLVLLVAAIVLSVNIDKPFIGHHDWNGAFWGAKIRHYVEYIRLQIGIEPASNLNTSLKNSSFFYTDYTPLLTVIFTFFSVIFGFSEFSLRFTSLIFSILMIFFIYKIGNLLFNKFIGILASILVIATPMFLYFGKLPDHEPIVVSLITITFYFFLKAYKNRKSYYLFLIFLTLSLLESWPAFFLIPPLVIFLFFLRKEKNLQKISPILVSIAVIVVHLISIVYLKGFPALFGFFGQGLARMNFVPNDPGLAKVTFSTFVNTEAHFAAVYFTNILLILSLIWIISFIWKLKYKKVSYSDWSLLILFIYPLSFILVFRQLAVIHDYKLYHFLPFIGLASAKSVNILTSKIESLFKKIKIKRMKYRIISILFCFLIILAVFIERIKFLNVLLKTSFNTPGYELGLLIRQETNPQDVVLVNSRQFKAFFEVFVTYYSDRYVDYENITLDSFKEKESAYKKYKYIILIDGRNEDPKIASYLKNSFFVERHGSYNFIDLSKVPENKN